MQLLETNTPMIIALNMVDVLDQQHGQIVDTNMLSKKLGCPVVPIQVKGKGVKALKQTITNTLKQTQTNIPLTNLPWLQHINSAVHDTIDQLSQIETIPPLSPYLALRLCEHDQYAQQLLNDSQQKQSKQIIQASDAFLEEDIDMLLADARYQFANQTVDSCLITQRKRRNITEKIDKIVLNKWLGLPIFILVMYLMFFFAINIGGAFQDFLISAVILY